VKAGRSEGPKNQETDQLEELWKSGARSFPKQSRSERRAHYETGQRGESKAVDLLAGTERREASPHQAKQSAEGLNEMTMDEVLSQENLNAAYRAVKANAGAPGVDEMSVKELKEHVRKHGETLKSKLRTGEYQPAAVRAVEIPKAKGGVRTLGIPTVVDRLIQQGSIKY
jgi:hypothetical protein